MDLSKERLDKLIEILEWRRTIRLNDTYRNRVLTYGTDSDKIVLQLFDSLGDLIRED